MVFSIRHRGLESSEALWRRNHREESLKLGAELHGYGAWQPSREECERAKCGLISPRLQRHFDQIALYGKMREELPKSFRNGMMLAQVGPISEITNFTSSVTYATIKDAVYLASSGDEIILPAGSGATHSASFTRYSNNVQLTSSPTYTNSSNVMVIGNPGFSSTTATYLSIVGIPSTNNLSSASWASTSGGQLTVVISGSAITTYRRGQYVRLSGCTNTGTGGAVAGAFNSINNTFLIRSVSGSTLVLTAPASAGVYGTIGGSMVLNNDRAQISGPVGYLTATLTPGDTTIQLDDATDFSTGGGAVYAWGNGDGTWETAEMTYTGVSGNNLTGVSSGGLPSTVPSGNPIILLVPGAKALFTPAATNPTGITMSNLELWGAAQFRSGAGIFQWVNAAGGTAGSLTLNNCFLHDNMFGIRPGNSSLGTGVFVELLNSELWRNGLPGVGFNHNMYVDCDTLTLSNSLSWDNLSGYAVKSRARVNYLLQTRTYGDSSLLNADKEIGSNYDFPNAGAVYLIDCMMSAGLHDSTSLIRYGEEVNYPPAGIGGSSIRGCANPRAEVYVGNSNGLAPSSGTGTDQSNVGAVSIGYPGLKCPEIPVVTTTSGGSLPVRSYWTAATLLDSGGNESLPSCMIADDAFTSVNAQTAIGANTLAVVPSPVARTGAVTWNNWMSHADPVMWWNSGGAGQIPPATGPNQFFWDSGFTQPMFVVNAGGSQPAAFCYVGITYVFPEGESINFAVGGASGGPIDVGLTAGYSFFFISSSSPVQTSAAIISVPSSNLLTIKSPPAMTGATGWYPYICVTTYNGGGTYPPPMPMSVQTDSAIAIGTDWVQTGPFRQAATMLYNLHKQNASPIAMGTGWTEPTSGLTDHNPTTALKWRMRRSDPGAISRWYAVVGSGQAATNYVVTAYNNLPDGPFTGNAQLCGAVQVWSGAVTPWPFDTDYGAASLTTSATSTTATTAATNTAIIASFRTGSTAGAGWTQDAAVSFLMVEHKIVSSPQAGSSVTQTGGSSTSIIVDAIVQSGSLAQRGSPQQFFNGNASTFQFTIPSISVGDVLVLDFAPANGIDVRAIDPLAWGPPCTNQALAHSPIGLIVNDAFAYFNPANSGFNTGGYLQTFPGATLFGGVGYPTVSSFNTQVNAYNGSGFNAPLVAAVWTNATTFDFSLVGGSPLIGAGTNPGTGGGYSLVPTTQPVVGTPTPGFPIANAAARTDNGLTLGAVGPGAPVPGPRLRWMKFGWDWKLGLAILAVAKVAQNPNISRRRMLLLHDGPASGETEPPDEARKRKDRL